VLSEETIKKNEALKAQVKAVEESGKHPDEFDWEALKRAASVINAFREKSPEAFKVMSVDSKVEAVHAYLSALTSLQDIHGKLVDMNLIPALV